MNLQSPNVQMSPIGLPNEVKLGSLDYSLPPDARSTSVKIQPSNISIIRSSTCTTSATLGTANSGTRVFSVSSPQPRILFPPITPTARRTITFYL